MLYIVLNLKKIDPMRKYRILLLALAGMVMLSSCINSKKTSSSVKDHELETFEFKFFANRSLSNAMVKSLYFYNSTQINISGEFNNKSTYVENGELFMIDSSIIIDKKINRRTVGKCDSITPDNNYIYISFSKEDYIYRFWFQKGNGGYYYLMHNGGTVTKGKRVYTLIAESDCVLKIKLTQLKKTIRKTGTAEGDDGT